MLNYSWKAGPNRWGRPEFNATFSISFWNGLINPSNLMELARVEMGSAGVNESGGDRDPSSESTKLELERWRAWASKNWTFPLVRPATFRSRFAGVLYIRKVCWFILQVRSISKPSYSGYYDTIIRYYDRYHKGKQRVFYSPYDTIMTILWHYYDTIIISIMTSIMTQGTIMTLYDTIMTLLWPYYDNVITLLWQYYDTTITILWHYYDTIMTLL